MNKFNEDVVKYIENVMTSLKKIDIEAVNGVINKIVETLNLEGTIYVFGNGGSANAASHLQNDFNIGLSDYSTKKFRVNCLSNNVATITAIANDISYDEIFRYQLKGRLRDNDLIIAISGSGNSKNVINAVSYAKSLNIPIVAFTGFGGGELKKLADYNLNVGIDDMQITEDIHLIFNHLIMSVLRKNFQKLKG